MLFICGSFIGGMGEMGEMGEMGKMGGMGLVYPGEMLMPRPIRLRNAVPKC